MNKRVMLQKETRVSDGAGGFTRTWSDVGLYWCSIIQKQGGERILSAQMTDTKRWNITMRYSSDVTTDKRFKEGATIYNIRDVNPDDNNMYMIVEAETRVAT